MRKEGDLALSRDRGERMLLKNCPKFPDSTLFTLKRFLASDHYLRNVVYLAFEIGDKYGE